jgi:hypothetical protein
MIKVVRVITSVLERAVVGKRHICWCHTISRCAPFCTAGRTLLIFQTQIYRGPLVIVSSGAAPTGLLSDINNCFPLEPVSILTEKKHVQYVFVMNRLWRHSNSSGLFYFIFFIAFYYTISLLQDYRYNLWSLT